MSVDYNPVNDMGKLPFTMTASTALTAGQVVESTGVNTVGPAGAASVKVVGVVAQDASGSGVIVTVYPRDMVHETVTGTGGVTAGQQVQAGAAGTIVTLGGSPVAGQDIGVAINSATVGNKAQWVGV